jgi:hypothetical protein
LSLSLGAIKPLPKTWRGTIKKPAAVSADCCKNFLRCKEDAAIQAVLVLAKCTAFLQRNDAIGRQVRGE